LLEIGLIWRKLWWSNAWFRWAVSQPIQTVL